MDDDIKLRIEALGKGEVPLGYSKGKVGIRPVEWKVWELNKCLIRVRKPVEVDLSEQYRQIGIRSHGKGLFYKESVSGAELGNKSVFWIEPECFIVNIVFAWEMAIGKTTQLEVGMIASHRFPMYKPKDKKICIDYLTYYFKSPRGKYFLELASPGGAGRNKTLGQTEFFELKLPFPLLQEQIKIARVLLTWDNVIELKEKLIKEKKKQKMGMMQRLLTGEVRLPGFDDEWESARIKDICDIFIGLTYTPQYVEKGVPFLSVKDINGGKISFESTRYISEEEYKGATKNAKPKKGDILFGRVGTLGNPIILEQDSEFCIFVSLGFLRITTDDVSKYFIKHWMESELFTKQINSRIAGSSQKNLNTGWLKEFNLMVPNLEEQIEIANILSGFEHSIELHSLELAALKLQKKGLMQLLLTGIVRVNIQQN